MSWNSLAEASPPRPLRHIAAFFLPLYTFSFSIPFARPRSTPSVRRASDRRRPSVNHVSSHRAKSTAITAPTTAAAAVSLPAQQRGHVNLRRRQAFNLHSSCFLPSLPLSLRPSGYFRYIFGSAPRTTRGSVQAQGGRRVGRLLLLGFAHRPSSIRPLRL